MNRMSYSNHNHEELIPVVYAHDLAEAEYFRSLLEDNDIPAFVDENFVPAAAKDIQEGVPVMVPEDNLEDAQDIIELHYHLNDDFEDERDAQEEDTEEDEYIQLDSDLEDPNTSSDLQENDSHAGGATEEEDEDPDETDGD